MTDDKGNVTGLTGDSYHYADAVAGHESAPAASKVDVKVEHREQVVRLVPHGLSVFTVPHQPRRTGRVDGSCSRPRRRGHAPSAPPDVRLEPINTSRKNGVGRNKPCPCGSGLKNKHCKCRG